MRHNGKYIYSKEDLKTFFKKVAYVADSLGKNVKYSIENMNIRLTSSIKDFNNLVLKINFLNQDGESKVAQLIREKGCQIEFYQFCQKFKEEIQRIS